MTIQEKLGIIYAKHDCDGRICDNCTAQDFCGGNKELLELIREVELEIRELYKAKEEANEKEG